MATFNAVVRTVPRATSSSQREFTAVHKTSFAGMFADAAPIRLGFTGVPIVAATRKIINRGKNTGAGDAYVYWLSPLAPDPTGVFYTGVVPFVQLTDIIWVGVSTLLEPTR